MPGTSTMRAAGSAQPCVGTAAGSMIYESRRCGRRSNDFARLRAPARRNIENRLAVDRGVAHGAVALTPPTVQPLRISITVALAIVMVFAAVAATPSREPLY